MQKIKLYNTLTKKIDIFNPINPGSVSKYSCGPTVYDNIHIGNLRAFIVSDTLRRVLKASHFKVKHVMNFTDVDDKTIKSSHDKFPEHSPEEALRTLTTEYSEIFLTDMEAIGNNVDEIDFIKATESIGQMRQLITTLLKKGFAYIADDGIYFSIEEYKNSGKYYGQLVKLSSSNTSSSRIDNDEYDKESINDFALWKLQKAGEPSWEFKIDGQNIVGRPGWHIECSAMSLEKLGIPFDIHTGGVDLIFPHHENEIAQSTASQDSSMYAKYFVHNEHLLINSKKMSKSLSNYFTLRDIVDKGYDPLAFRLLILQSSYQHQSNFSWESLDTSSSFLDRINSWADLIHQPVAYTTEQSTDETYKQILESIQNNLDTPRALAILSAHIDHSVTSGINPKTMPNFLTQLDELLGLRLSQRENIDENTKQLIAQRQRAKINKEWGKSDDLRDELHGKGIGIRDSQNGQIWYRIS